MKLLSTVLFICFLQNSFSATFYISPKGNDITGNGSINKPWQTLYRATSTITSPGNIIHVTAGTYIESQQIILAIGVSVEGDGIASVLKNSLTADWSALLSATSIEGTNGNQHISNLKFDGQNLSAFWGIYVAGRSNVSIHDCTIVDFKDRGVLFGGRNDNVDSAPLIFATGNTFYNNIVSNCAGYTSPLGNFGRGCLNIGGQEDMLIYNNIIIQNQRPVGYNGYCIKLLNDGYLRGIKIYNNTIVKIPFSGNYGGENGWDFAIELWNILGGLEIYGNSIQGAIDLVNTSKNNFSFGVWFHDNKIFQKNLNKHYESGVIFELSTESAIVENNIFDKISGCILFNAQENTVINDITIRNNSFTNIGKNDNKGNNGNGINLNCGTLFGNNLHYTVTNFLIINNIIIAANTNSPYYGIELTGAAFAKNIKIQNNSIKNFKVACFIANPAYVIDTLLIENNILSGNGNNNTPLYIGGAPDNYIFKKNIKTNSSAGSSPGFNFREQILRPFYYDIKRTAMLEFIALFAGILSVFFSRKEYIYVYPMVLINSVIYTFLNFDKGLFGEAGLTFCFIVISIYGWVMWSKRDYRNHRVIRITSSTKKDWYTQFIFFISFFIVIFFAIYYLKEAFATWSIPWADAFTSACAFTGMWLMTKKKVECWYWWIAANITSIPLFYEKHLVFISGYYGIMLALCVGGVYEWGKKKGR